MRGLISIRSFTRRNITSRNDNDKRHSRTGPMSDATLRTDGSLEAQPRMGVRNLHNFIYCPRLFYFQWVENIFQENADTVEGAFVHRNVDRPTRLKNLEEIEFPEGTEIKSLCLE